MLSVSHLIQANVSKMVNLPRIVEKCELSDKSDDGEFLSVFAS